MTDYCTTADVKLQLGIPLDDTTDDALLAGYVTNASRDIDHECGRQFTGVYDTRTRHAIYDVKGQILYLDEDLAAIEAVINGNGVTVAGSDYVTLPPNTVPFHALALKSNSSISWTYSGAAEDAISITGTWGYTAGTTPPHTIRNAAIHLAAWYYHNKDAPFANVGAAENGLQGPPNDIPDHIARKLTRYKKMRITTVDRRAGY
jgi:hypothetical protein